MKGKLTANSKGALTRAFQISNFKYQIAKLLRKRRPSELRRCAPRNDKLVACGKTIARSKASADWN
jgi:hypothetical protein